MTAPTPAPLALTPAQALDISFPSGFTLPTSIDINLSFTLPTSIAGLTVPPITIVYQGPSTSSTPTPSTTSSSPTLSSTTSSDSSSSSSTPSPSSTSQHSSSRTALVAGVFTVVGLLALGLLFLALYLCRRRRRRRQRDEDIAEAGVIPKGNQSRSFWRVRGGRPSVRSASLRSVRTSTDADSDDVEDGGGGEIRAKRVSEMAFAGTGAYAYHARHLSQDDRADPHAALLAPSAGDAGALSPTTTFDVTPSALLSPTSPLSPATHARDSYFPTLPGGATGAFTAPDAGRYAALRGGVDPFADDAPSETADSASSTREIDGAPYAHRFGLGPGDPDYQFIEHGPAVYPWMTYAGDRSSSSGGASHAGSTNGPGTSSASSAYASAMAGGVRAPFGRQTTGASSASSHYYTPGEHLPARMSSHTGYGSWLRSPAADTGAPAPTTMPFTMPSAAASNASGVQLTRIPERAAEGPTDRGTLSPGHFVPQTPSGPVTPANVGDERDYMHARPLQVTNH